MSEILREKLLNDFNAARERTLQIFELADEDILRQSPGFGFRPILWHLAHLGAFEEYWLLQQIKGDKPSNERYQIIFDPIKTPRENSANLPTKAEMHDYLLTIRNAVRKHLETIEFDEDNEHLRGGYIFDLVLQHELQHQETLAYLFHLLPSEKIQSSRFKVQSLCENQTANDKRQRTKDFQAIEIEIGANVGEFAYDNEMPAHKIFVPAFRLDRFLTTNAEFAEFVCADGYRRSEFWSADGWAVCQKENWRHPLYWREHRGDWTIRTMFADKTLDESKKYPVYGISFYEAEAFARFCGKRLPTEFEWERAASFNDETAAKRRFALNSELSPQNCNFDFAFWNTTPVDYFSEENGVCDLNGNLWEWTASDFAPYPNFSAFPYPEYSAEWFDGDHKVLKGGSFATAKQTLRTSFRNFFRRPFRIAFAGIRLADDV